MVDSGVHVAKGGKLTMKKTEGQPKSTSGFETTLWAAADKLRGNMDASEYKHVALGLIFLKYISDRFEDRRAQALADPEEAGLVGERDLYIGDNVFWVPEQARWDFLKAMPPARTRLSAHALIKPCWTQRPRTRASRAY